MKPKSFLALAFALMPALLFTHTPSGFTAGFKEGGASLLLPTTGQTMNGQFSAKKTKLMAVAEVASIATLTVVATATGPLWLGLAPLAATHVWSASDAFMSAQPKRDPVIREQMREAQKNLELSRQRRFERGHGRSDIRARVRRAREAFMEEE